MRLDIHLVCFLQHQLIIEKYIYLHIYAAICKRKLRKLRWVSLIQDERMVNCVIL